MKLYSLFLWILLSMLGLAAVAPEAAAWLAPVVKGGKEVIEGVVQKGGREGLEQAGRAGATKVIGGSSVVLAKRLGLKAGSDFQAHHIVPIELRHHRTLNKIGFDLDCLENGLALPGRPGLHPTLPVHKGYHAGYSRAVMRDLDEIPRGLSVNETRKRVLAVTDNYRQRLESGTSLYSTPDIPDALRW